MYNLFSIAWVGLANMLKNASNLWIYVKYFCHYFKPHIKPHSHLHQIYLNTLKAASDLTQQHSKISYVAS